MGPSGQLRRVSLALAVGVLVAVGADAEAHASSANELVREAHVHEAASEDELAVRRYMDALSLDPTCEEAYLGLASFRVRRGDLREAERVFSVALEHLPGLRAARLGRAEVRRALGARAAAIEDLLIGGADDLAGLRVLAGWYGEEGQVPAQLAVWRRLLARAESLGEATLVREARAVVRALLIIVGSADPVTGGGGEGAIRRLAATLARKGG